ncbi:MAG: DUF2695 domain-containing protein [Janthinobacterium lividum]
MPSNEEKQRRNQLKQQLRATAKESFLTGLPMQLLLFQELFDFLDEKLACGCDDTLRLTEQFAKENDVQVERLKTWLGEHGGYCDCEVLANVEEEFEGLL